MMKTVQYGLMAGLIAAAMLLYAADGLPKVSAANRETIRIMKNIKIPPPYTPVYQPPTGQQYVPPASITPDSSKITPAQLSPAPSSTTVAPPLLPVMATNATNVTVTNVPAGDKAVKTPVPAVTPEKEKASEDIKADDKTPANEKK